MRQLVKSINKELPDEARLPDEKVERAFARLWPEFAEKLKTIMQQQPGKAPIKRSPDEMIEEILAITRQLSVAQNEARNEAAKYRNPLLQAWVNKDYSDAASVAHRIALALQEEPKTVMTGFKPSLLNKPTKKDDGNK